MVAAKRDTFVTRTWLVRTPASGSLTLSRLMEESERRLYGAARSSIPNEALIATRILDNAHDFSRWEAEHATLMERVADERVCRAQVARLLSGALTLIHRKALFEYLRDAEIRGEARRLLFRQLFGERDYQRIVILEHGNYLRSAASFLCSRHLGQRLLLQPLFANPLARYETLYGDYFRTYCEFAIAELRGEPTTDLRPLIGPLKRDVGEYRVEIMRLAHAKGARSGAH